MKNLNDMLDDFIQFADGSSRPKTRKDKLEDDIKLRETHYYYNGEWYPYSDERSHPM